MLRPRTGIRFVRTWGSRHGEFITIENVNIQFFTLHALTGSDSECSRLHFQHIESSTSLTYNFTSAGGSDTSLNGDTSRDDLSDDTKSPQSPPARGCGVGGGGGPLLTPSPLAAATLGLDHRLAASHQQQYSPIKQEAHQHTHIAMVNS